MSEGAKLFEVLERLKVRGKLQSTQSKDSISDYIQSASSIRFIDYDLSTIEEILISKSPFIYLSQQERELIKTTSKFIEIFGLEQEVIHTKKNFDYHMMLILEGELFAIDSKSNYCEVLGEGDSFGADACLFGETDYSILTSTPTTKIMMIPTQTFFQLLNCEKQFTLILGRNLLYKQKIFSALEKFTSFTAEGANLGEVDLHRLVKIYKKINSSLHANRKSRNLDISAWKYAIRRLPDNLTSTFIYLVTDAMQDILKNDDRIAEVQSSARKRTIYKTLTGKNVVILRDMQSDLNDLLSNLCIHYVEAKKLRRKLKLPTVLTTLVRMENIRCLPLLEEELKGLEEIWREKAVENVRNIILHHEDYKIMVTTSSANLRAGPSERWTETLWEGCQKSIGHKIPISEAVNNGLVVDVVQGSTKTLLNLISPYIKKNSKKITNWFSRSKITMKTKEFYKETDKLFAACFYYLKKFPAEEELKRKLEEESGIISIEDTEMTGVKVMIVNVSKLNLETIKPKSPMHLIINIGYTFGKQGYDIIKCFNLLFENCIDSFSFIGKAGGLQGKRQDVLLSTKFHDMSTKGMTLVNPSGIDLSFFENLGISVHKGPMLTVAGTILQNKKLLTYYKHIEGCVGLEMEGCYFAQAIQQGIEMDLLKETIPTRFLYYVSDIPLDPSTNLAQEENNVSWDEGIPTMSAITEHCLSLCSNVEQADVKDRAMRFVNEHNKVAIVQKELEICKALLELGYGVVYFASADENVPEFVGKFVTVDYCEDSEYFLRIESIVKQSREKKNVKVVVLNDPEANEFWVPTKVINNSKIRYNTTKVCKNYRVFRDSELKTILITNNSRYTHEGKIIVLKKINSQYFHFQNNEEISLKASDLLNLLENN